jgi:hypothetical protein
MMDTLVVDASKAFALCLREIRRRNSKGSDGNLIKAPVISK